MQDGNQAADYVQMNLFRRSADFPGDFVNTPSENANRAYQRLFATRIAWRSISFCAICLESLKHYLKPSPISKMRTCTKCHGFLM